MVEADDVEHGVYYHTSDYLGVGRRFLIDMIDILVAAILSIAVSLIVLLVIQDDDLAALAVLTAWIVVWFAYFVVLKSSRFRTAGYRLARAKIVNLRGEAPSIASLTVRLLFAVFGPLNLLFDLFWIPSDSCRQALRDKFAHTYVVRRDASPVGSGPIRYATYTIFGGSFLFQEVTGSQAGGAR